MSDPEIPKKRVRILVNGGGIAGLAFAQAMRKIGNENIEVVVFEKETEESPFQQYPLHISPSGRSSLLSILSPSSFTSLASRSSTGRGIDNAGIHICDPRFNRLFAIERWKGEMPVFVLRWVLKQELEVGVDVRRGRRAVEVSELEGGKKVRVRFDDESFEDGDFLVGAEGLSSPTLTHLLSLSSPQTSPTRLRTLPYLTLNFKLLSPSVLTPHLPSQTSINMILSSSLPAYSLILVPLLGTPSSTLLNLTDEQAGFTYGILTISTSDFPEWRDATDGGLKNVVLRTLRAAGDCKEEVLEAVEKEWVDGSAGCWEVVNALRENGKGTVSGWEEGEAAAGRERVVLIGDAAHAMPPFGGVGAASALEDAVELARVVCTSELGGEGGLPIGPALAEFKTSMLKRALALSQDSERRLGLSQKGGWFEVWIRWALMRLMDKSLPLALWVLSRKREATGRSG